MNTMWAAQYDEAHDEVWGVIAQNSAKAADRKIDDLFDYIGAPYPQRPESDEKWVHANGADWAMSSATRDDYRGESTQPLITQSLRTPARPALGSTSTHALLDG